MASERPPPRRSPSMRRPSNFNFGMNRRSFRRNPVLERPSGPSAFDRILGPQEKYDPAIDDENPWSNFDQFIEFLKDAGSPLLHLVGIDYMDNARILSEERSQMEQLLAARCGIPEGSHLIAIVGPGRNPVPFYEHLDPAFTRGNVREGDDIIAIIGERDNQCKPPPKIEDDGPHFEEIVRSAPSAFDTHKSQTKVERSFDDRSYNNHAKPRGNGHYSED